MKEIPKAIEKILSILDNYKVLYWLEAGTLLKGVRDKDILKSSDFDVATTSDNVEKIFEALKELESEGYQLNFQGGFPMFEDLIQIKLPQKINRIDLFEIYVYHEFNGAFIRRNPHKPTQNTFSKHLFALSKKISIMKKNHIYFDEQKKHSLIVLQKLVAKIIFSIYEFFGTTTWSIAPSYFFDNLTSRKINNRKFKIPKSYKEYLLLRYGENWNDPIDRDIWIKSWNKGESDFLEEKKLSENFKIPKIWL